MEYDLKVLNGDIPKLTERRESDDNCVVPVELLMLVPQSDMHEDLMVFGLEHQRLVYQHKAPDSWAISDLYAKIPENHSLKGAMMFTINLGGDDNSYEKINAKLIKSLTLLIKQRVPPPPSLKVDTPPVIQTRKQHSHTPLRSKSPNKRYSYKKEMSSEWFYYDPSDGRKRPTMALKDWRQSHGLCRACGSNEHSREHCGLANRIATRYQTN